jgi:hypothetical protein
MWHIWGKGEFVVRKPEGERPLGRPRHRWEDNIKTSSGSRMCGHGLD